MLYDNHIYYISFMVLTQEILFKNKQNKFYQKILKAKSSKQDFADVFTCEPNNIEEVSLGNLYFVAELLNISVDSSYLINLLTSIIRREYYSKPNRGPFESFEATLKKTNSILTELIQKTDAKKNLEWIGKLNCVCASVCNDSLYFTQIGQFKTLICRQGNLINIGKKINSTAQNLHALGTFQNIVSGKLEKGDKLLFLPQKLFDFISIDGIKQICALNNITDNCEQINKILREHKSFSPPLAAFLLEIAPDELPENPVIFCSANEYITPPIELEEIIFSEPAQRPN